MKKNKVSLLLIATGAFLFNSIFWNEQLALNAVLFDAFMITSVFYLYDDAWKNNTVKYLSAAHFVSLCMVIVFNSLLSKIAFSVTLLLLITFAEYAHRSVWLAGGSLLLSLAKFTGEFFRLVRSNRAAKQKTAGAGRFIRMAIFPLLTVVVFFIIYCSANTVFAGIAGDIGNKIGKTFSGFFDLFSPSRTFFLLLGFYLTGALLLRASQSGFEEKEAVATDQLPRTRKRRMDINRSLAYDLTVGIMGRLAKGTWR